MTVNDKIQEMTDSLIELASVQIHNSTEGFLVTKAEDQWSVSMWFEPGGDITVCTGASHLSALKECLKFLRKK